MKIGDYVRNKYGIAKVIDIENKNGTEIIVFDRDIAFLVDKETDVEIGRTNRLIITEYIDLDKINKSSNIIDLIEVGDYVNGSKVIDIAQAPKKALYLDNISQHCGLIPRTNNDIKLIVTKEQFEAMEYKVK